MTLGIDLAAVDGNTNISWSAAYAAGARFAYLKASQHIYPDTQHHANAVGARTTGLVVGAYHFPGWGDRSAGAKLQISAFKSPANIASGDLPPCLDIEGFENCGWTSAVTVEFIRQLVLEVEDQMGVTPAIYTSFYQWDSLGRPAMQWAARCPLFIKTAYRHPARAPYDPSPPTDPHGGMTAEDPKCYYRIPDPWNGQWWVQQYDGDAVGFPGFNRTVDVDRFHAIAAPQGDTLESGPHIAWLQDKLKITADGVYGPLTAAAVRAAQSRAGLPETGAVDVATFAVIAWL